MTDWTGGPDPEHDNELDGGYKADWLKEQAPGHAVRGKSDRPVESPAEFDNWAQDEAAADLEKLEFPPPGSEPA